MQAHGSFIVCDLLISYFVTQLILHSWHSDDHTCTSPRTGWGAALPCFTSQSLFSLVFIIKLIPEITTFHSRLFSYLFAVACRSRCGNPCLERFLFWVLKFLCGSGHPGVRCRRSSKEFWDRARRRLLRALVSMTSVCTLARRVCCCFMSGFGVIARCAHDKSS